MFQHGIAEDKVKTLILETLHVICITPVNPEITKFVRAIQVYPDLFTGSIQRFHAQKTSVVWQRTNLQYRTRDISFRADPLEFLMNSFVHHLLLYSIRDCRLSFGNDTGWLLSDEAVRDIHQVMAVT